MKSEQEVAEKAEEREMSGPSSLVAGRQVQLALFLSQFSYLAACAAWARARTLYLYKGSQKWVFWKKVEKSFWDGVLGASVAWLGGQFTAVL